MIKFVITEEELDQIKNDCAYPERFECDNGCEYWFEEKDIPCTFKGANILMDEVMTRTLEDELKKERERLIAIVENRTGNWYHLTFDRLDALRNGLLKSMRGEP
jgi:hypothetical protein